MYCWNCGKEIDDNALECPNCGKETKKKYEDDFKKQKKQISKLAATVSSYTNRNTIGLTGFILSIISFVFPLYFVTPSIAFIVSLVGTIKQEDYLSWNEFAYTGLVFSVISIILYIILAFTTSISLWIF